MALPPTLKPLLIIGQGDAPHTLDIFLDYVCPFSAKMARTMDNVLKPLFDEGGQYAGKVKIIFRPQVQPWHASSTLTHESALAVARASPGNFWPYSLLLFKNQENYFDIPTSAKTPIQIRESLTGLASELVAPAVVEKIAQLLQHTSSPNGGTGVTDDLKYTIKFSRQNGIHVSPTVLWDGLVANEISSGWTEKEWKEFLAAKVLA